MPEGLKAGRTNDDNHEAVDELVARGQERGWLTEEEIASSLCTFALPREQVDHIYRLIENKGIDVVDREPAAEVEVPDTRRDPGGKGLTSDPVRMYLNQIGKVALLNAEGEVDLAVRIEAGVVATRMLEDPKHLDFQAVVELAHACHLEVASRTLTPDRAREICRRVERDGAVAKAKLIEANLRLVVSIAKRYVGRGMSLLDLIQEGNLGLIRGAEKFDYKRGFKFSTYATWWIRQAISRGIADQSRTVRLPAHMVEIINRLVWVRRHILQDLGREPTAHEIADEMGMTADRVHEILKFSQAAVSLEAPLSDESDLHLGDLIEDVNAEVPLDAASFALLRDQLEAVLHTLSEREKKVIQLRFGLEGGEPRTLEEVGLEFGLTRERIRQIESKTLCKLRHPARSDRLRDFLD